MFSIGVVAAIALLAWYSHRQEAQERKVIPVAVEDDYLRERVLFIREDVRLVAYLLMGILMMLGIIADRIH